MYRRFLNNSDYQSLIAPEQLTQLTRGNQTSILQAEEMAEMSLVEYLTNNYEIEEALEVGKRLVEYNNRITYPVGSHFYLDGQIVEAIRSINGLKTPTTEEYWEVLDDYPFPPESEEKPKPYSQTLDYIPGDIVNIAGKLYRCLLPNGYGYNDIHIPGIEAWEKVDAEEWMANYEEYEEWGVVKYENHWYALVSLEDIDYTENPLESDNWGLIADYDSEVAYEFKDNEYVVYDDCVFHPVMNPIADELVLGKNYRVHDPRNGNIKKHLARLAVWELHKLVSPNNMSQARITDYEATMTWLHDANRCKINPKIPRKVDHERKPVSEVVVATFMRDYDPYKNPWQI